MNKSLLLALLLACCFFTHAQDNFAPIDSIVKTYEGKTVPGFSVCITKNGKTVYNNHAGYANIEKNKQIKDNTVFYLASISKQFTAGCIVLLEQQGKLNLNDNLRKYIPEFPAYAENITLLHLLTHTGGLKDYRILSTLRGGTSDDYTDQEIKDMIIALEPDNKPGEKWNYSNTGYWCLVRIIEQVSGQSIADFAHDNIFRPLKMKHTKYVKKPKNKVRKKAEGYEEKNDKYTTCRVDAFAIGGGGVYSTLGDLQKWLTEMQTHRVLGDTFWKSMTEDDAYKSEDFTYAKGLFISGYGTKTMINHGGDVDGYHPLVAYFPQDSVSAIILTNDDNFKRYDILRASVNRQLGFKYKYPNVKSNVPPVTALKDFSPYSGKYTFGENGYVLIEENYGQLVLTYLSEGITAILKPGAETHNFVIDGTEVTVVFSDIHNNKAQKIKSTNDGDITDFSRIEKMPENPSYKDYEGSYYCQALKAGVSISTNEGMLYYMFANNKTDWALHDENESFATRYGTISFKRDANGKISGLILDHERAKNLEYTKQESE